MKRDESGRIVEFAAASESIALEAIGIERERDVAAGEALFIDMQMQLHAHVDALAQTLTPCVFEYVYLARPDSVMDNISVYEARVQMGVRLADRVRALRVRQSRGKIDVLAPDDPAYDPQFPRLEEMIDCAFIMPAQQMRQRSIRIKHNPIHVGETKRLCRRMR